MTRSVIILTVAALAAFALPAAAQTAPDSENGRYSFSGVPDGMLRLDTRTGAVSLCAKQATGWACNAVPDERAALENEIARLQRENGALKKDMLARGLPLPGGVASGPAGKPARAEPQGAAAERCRDRSRDGCIREDVAPPRRHDAEVAEQRQDLSVTDTDP